MKLKKISIVTCFLLQITLLTSCATTDGLGSRTEARLDAASEYATGLDFFVGRVARNCTDLLERDDAFRNQIIDEWAVNNGKFVAAGKLWTSVRVLTIIRQTEEELGTEKAMEAGTAAEGEMSEIAIEIGTEMVDAVLSGSRAEQVKICHGFPDEIRAGRYDITPESQHYHMLMAILEAASNQ